MTERTVDSDQLRIGERAWFVTKDGWESAVYHGEVIAAGPAVLVIDVDGPWSNIVGGPRIVKRPRARPGRAPRMRAGISFLDYLIECTAIVEHDQRVAELERQAQRLGLTVSGIKTGEGSRR
jgi:hypothetical protein